MDCVSPTDGCETLLSLSAQATNPVDKSNATRIILTRLCFSVVFIPAPLTDFLANIAGASALLNTLCISGRTHKSYDSNVTVFNALPLTRRLIAWHYRRSEFLHKSLNGYSNGALI